MVTWEGTEISGDVVAIFNCRKSAKTIKDFIEQFYMVQNYSLHEKLTYAYHGKNNPYSAKYTRSENGVERIICGHNPFLCARLVIKIMVSSDADGKDHLTWDEIKVPTKVEL